ncbi:PAS domain-containing protein [Marinomonas pontica]|uniref:PAS domain-containing protein n=1 Tax=Marinomonas pontica TaxID=264739 RepID=UPI002244AE5C|nr:PAS domain-containing protein [Marinomonas pontica]MCW8356978.1 PAS domain-containing protein [Marinomonas pontica]
MKDSSNEIIGYLGMAMDITEQKNNQQALIYAHDQLLMAAEVAQLGIWNWDIEGNTLEWNDLMLDIYQYPLSKRKDGIVYEDWLSRLHPDDREMAAEALKNAVDGTGYYDMVFRIILPNNKIRYISASASLQENPEGNKTIMMGLFVM